MVTIIALLVLLFLGSCVSELDPVMMPSINMSTIDGTVGLDVTATKQVIEGVYKVVSEESTTSRFDSIISVNLASNGEVNMYSTTGVTYFTMYGGTRSDSGVFVGRWRGVQGPSAGSITMIVRPDEGGIELAKGVAAAKDLTLRCQTRSGNGNGTQTLVLRRVAKLNEDLKDFQIIAHRGGGRNSERLGVSENGIAMMLLAPQLGATGIEIDVIGTKDGTPIVFHDPDFTSRTIKGSYIIGPVKNYTLEQIGHYVRLINGERIPTLEEALDSVIDRTELQMVWLDVKDAFIVDRILTIQKAANARSKTKGRDLKIYFGVPTTDIKRAFDASPENEGVDVLCELDAQTALDMGAEVWAPRFTDGLQQGLAESMIDAGIRVFVWTLDDAAFIEQFLSPRYKGKLLYTGILTNYPTLLASRFYTLKVKP